MSPDGDVCVGDLSAAGVWRGTRRCPPSPTCRRQDVCEDISGWVDTDAYSCNDWSTGGWYVDGVHAGGLFHSLLCVRWRAVAYTRLSVVHGATRWKRLRYEAAQESRIEQRHRGWEGPVAPLLLFPKVRWADPITCHSRTAMPVLRCAESGEAGPNWLLHWGAIADYAVCLVLCRSRARHPRCGI
jgi:hypothetical protein